MNNNNSHCLNCGQKLLGDFCHLCGQQNTDLNLTFTELVRDFLGDMFTYDSRFYRTILPLLIKPGFLTLEFYKGKRIPYVPPLRLYLFISFILFLWLTLVGGNSINIGSPDISGDEIASTIGAENPDWNDDWVRKLEQSSKAVMENPIAFVSLITSRLPYLMFVLLPIFALIMWLHFALSGYNYLQHFVFTLHFHAFAYLLNLLFSLSDTVITWSYGGWAILLCNIYLGFAMRKAYGSSVAGCIFKTISILTIYLSILGLAFAAFILVNVLNYSN